MASTNFEFHLSNMISNFLSELSRFIFVSWSWWWDGLTENPTSRVTPTLVAATLLAISLYVWLIKKPFTSSVPPLPPGPLGLPLLGNLPFLEPDLHRYFAKLSEIYGPIMKLQLGRKICVVISSPSLAKQVLKDYDAIFSNRDPTVAAIASTYGGDIAWSPNGPEWRKLRKILIQEIMSKTSLDSCHTFRRQEVRKMVKEVYAKAGSPINIGEQMFLTILNVIMRMAWGASLNEEDILRVGIQFRQVVDEFIDLWGAPNVSDLFPILARFDLQGVESKVKKLSSWFDKMFESLIDSRTKDHQAGGENKEGKGSNKDFLEILLDDSSLSMNQVKALLLDTFLGGTHTTSTTIEWLMAELLRHPEIMRKACKELEEVVGKDNIVEEFHTSKLHYLDAILKETLRLHPALPLLVPRSSCTAQTISEYTIPKGSRVLFNVWAMQRDPEAWENPLEFQPERFLRDAGKGEYKGNNYNFLPFGSGRRICPGISLAEKMILYVVSTLLHSFEWNIPHGTTLDLSEKFGLVTKMQEPLIAIPIAYSSSEHFV
ncbi:hypothetical protein Dsin_014911 [Dipteronia sinensis]|uniref:Cytochrome P450 n=1 Tax=Dipteronia sinensis TaxID=43782 RepID=A0AAE0EAC1_9ROSI|nr:hypothetical protein Dsin_014911 [Dipteronia sinensis]